MPRMNRLGFSLQTAFAGVLVLCLMLGCYRMGRTDAEQDARRYLMAIDQCAAETALYELSNDSENWAALRSLVRRKSKAWHSMDGDQFRRYRQNASLTSN